MEPANFGTAMRSNLSSRLGAQYRHRIPGPISRPRLSPMTSMFCPWWRRQCRAALRGRQRICLTGRPLVEPPNVLPEIDHPGERRLAVERVGSVTVMAPHAPGRSSTAAAPAAHTGSTRLRRVDQVGLGEDGGSSRPSADATHRCSGSDYIASVLDASVSGSATNARNSLPSEVVAEADMWLMVMISGSA